MTDTPLPKPPTAVDRLWATAMDASDGDTAQAARLIMAAIIMTRPTANQQQEESKSHATL